MDEIFIEINPEVSLHGVLKLIEREVSEYSLGDDEPPCYDTIKEIDLTLEGPDSNEARMNFRRARRQEGRQGGRDDDRGDVLGAKLLTRDIDAEPLENVRHQLFGEGRIAEPVAGPVLAHLGRRLVAPPRPALVTQGLRRRLSVAEAEL